jgi:branched-subunit amino acid aminotransferase/4-amino-4-deoxychorismate lyase
MNGITRQKVIDVCRADGIPVFERNYSLVDTYGADEAFLTGTFGAQTAVSEIDGRQIGAGDDQPHSHALQRARGPWLIRSGLPCGRARATFPRL